jgi:Dolichyl-phosphate-mannose-protein mannosyltransferase
MKPRRGAVPVPAAAAAIDAAPSGATPAQPVAAQSVRPKTTAVRHRVDWAAGVVAAAALGLSLYRLGAPSLWMDETLSVALAQLPLGTLLHWFWSQEANMVLYYLMLHGWLALTTRAGYAPTEFIVRLPSAVCAALCAVVILAIGRRIAGQTAGLVAAGLFMLSGWQLTYAQEVRGYSLETLLICCAWYALLVALDRPTRQAAWWSVFAACMILAMYAQVFSGLVLLAQFVAIAGLLIVPSSIGKKVRAQLRTMVIAFVVIGIAAIPLMLAVKHGKQPSWLPAPDPAAILQRLLGGGHQTDLLVLAVAGCVILGFAAIVLTRIPPMKRFMRRLLSVPDAKRHDAPVQLVPQAIVLGCWLVVPVVVSYAVSLGPIHIFSSRYLIVVLPALCLFAGLGVQLIRVPWVKLALMAVLMGGTALTLPQYYAHAQIEDWRSPVGWMVRNYQPGDGMVCYNSYQGCQIGVSYYLQVDGNTVHFPADAPGAVNLRVMDSGGYPFSGANYALNRSILTRYLSHHKRLFFIEARVGSRSDHQAVQATQAWLDTQYTFVAQVSSNVATIRLYDVGSGASAP